jgi:hypothetical protein
MMDFDFEIRNKRGSEMPADFLSRSLVEIGAISALDMNWAHDQEKENLSNLIQESLVKKRTYKFPMPGWYKKAEFFANMAVLKITSFRSRKMKDCCFTFLLSSGKDNCLRYTVTF